MNLKTKLWLLIAASSITGIILFVSTTWLLGSLLNQGYTHQSLTDIGERITEEAERSAADPAMIREVMDRYAELYPDINFEWITNDGELVYATDGRQQAYRFEEMMDRFLNMPDNLWQTGDTVTLMFDSSLNGSRHYFFLSLPSEAMQSSQVYFYVRDNASFLQWIFPFFLFILTPYLFAILFFSRMNRRLQKLNHAMNAMSANHSVVQLHDSANDEIGQLTRHFNSMAERINRQITQIQEFEAKRKSLIANISHDLRTPMTMIEGYAEVLHAGMYQDEEQRKSFTEIILRRSRYMDQLLQKLLEISQLDAQKDQLRLEHTNLSELLRRIAADYVRVLENQEMELDIQIPEHAIIAEVDVHLIERAVRNLIENVMQYGYEGNYLGLALKESGSHVYIMVADRGPGIPEDQKSQIFDRFYRGSHGREGEGIGIGLSIVQEIALAHKGTVELNSKPFEQTTFTLILRLKSTPL